MGAIISNLRTFTDSSLFLFRRPVILLHRVTFGEEYSYSIFWSFTYLNARYILKATRREINLSSPMTRNTAETTAAKTIPSFFAEAESLPPFYYLFNKDIVHFFTSDNL